MNFLTTFLFTFSHVKGKFQMIFIISPQVVHKSVVLCADLGNLLWSWSRKLNTLTIPKNNTLNKDDDIGGSQIPVMWQCNSITIPLAKQVHLFRIYACLPLLFCFLELLMHAF